MNVEKAQEIAKQEYDLTVEKDDRNGGQKLTNGQSFEWSISYSKYEFKRMSQDEFVQDCQDLTESIEEDEDPEADVCGNCDEDWDYCTCDDE